MSASTDAREDSASSNALVVVAHPVGLFGPVTQEPPRLFVVRLARGGPWDWSRDLREQAGFPEHARFMDALVAEGFILLGGPLDNERETLHIVHAAAEEEIRARLAQDPWAGNGMLSIASIERWTILLDGRT